MSFAIKKLKSIAAVVRSGRHTFREQLTPNADPAMTRKNRVVGAASANDLKARLEHRLPGKIKARSVLCIEYLITASPEAFKRHGGTLDDMGGGYFNDALKWLQQRHGKDNVISSAVHLDESTPHLVAYVVPMTVDHRLSCRDFLGGPSKMRQMHTDFHEACGRKRGLDRGLEGSKAKHHDIKSFYATLNAAGLAPQLEAKDYAAAALGIKTTAWRKAEALAKSQAQSAAVGPTMKKALASRGKAISKKTEELGVGLQVFEQKRILLKQTEEALERRSKALEEREREANADEYLVLALKAERDTLLRRLEILETRTAIQNMAPIRGRKYESENTLTQS